MSFVDKLQFALFAWAGVLIFLSIGFESVKILKTATIVAVLGTLVWLFK